MNKQHRICLSPAERREIGSLIRRDGAGALTQRRARILLHADAGVAGPRLPDVEVAAAVGVEPRTVARVRAQYAAEGVAATLARRPRGDRRPRKLDGDTEARLVALACTAPPPGHARWTLAPAGGPIGRVGGGRRHRPRDRAPALKKTSSSRG